MHERHELQKWVVSTPIAGWSYIKTPNDYLLHAGEDCTLTIEGKYLISSNDHKFQLQKGNFNFKLLWDSEVLHLSQ